MRAWTPCIAIAAALLGCLDHTPVADVSADAGAPDGDAARPAPAVRSWVVRDVTGRIYPPDAVPRRPVLHIETTVPLGGDTSPVALFAGPPNEALADDLARPPLRSAHEARSVPVAIDRVGTALRVAPEHALAPGDSYTLAIAAWAADEAGRTLGTPFVAALVVGVGPSSGAVVTDAWPADGTYAVPPQLSMAAVRFDGEAYGVEGIRLLGPDGAEVSARRQPVLCDLVGWSGGRCVLLRPERALAPNAEHSLVVDDGVRDATGAAIGPWAATFHTTTSLVTPALGWLAVACALDEEPLALGCALVDDRSVTLRVKANAPARLWLVAAEATTSAVASRGEARLRLAGLSAGREHALTLRAVDLAGRERIDVLTAHTPSDLAPLAITEVRADARGDEPEQEYVEIANVGEAPVDLAGFALSDDPQREGDVIEAAVVIAPGARALLVADGFEADDGADDPVPPGVTLVRLGPSLAGGGLKNGGEPLFLRDPAGRRVSAAPALPSPHAGACIVRVTDDPRTGETEAFAPDALGGCTPGRPDRHP